MDMDNLNGKMVQLYKVIGLMENVMELQYILIQKENKEQASMKMEN